MIAPLPTHLLLSCISLSWAWPYKSWAFYMLLSIAWRQQNLSFLGLADGFSSPESFNGSYWHIHILYHSFPWKHLLNAVAGLGFLPADLAVRMRRTLRVTLIQKEHVCKPKWKQARLEREQWSELQIKEEAWERKEEQMEGMCGKKRPRQWWSSPWQEQEAFTWVSSLGSSSSVARMPTAYALHKKKWCRIMQIQWVSKSSDVWIHCLLGDFIVCKTHEYIYCSIILTQVQQAKADHCT